MSEGSGRGDDETNEPGETISLLDIITVLAKHKALIGAFTVLAAVASIGYALLTIVLPPDKSPLPNNYQGKALIVLKSPSSSDSSSLSQLSGLAALAGVSIGKGMTGNNTDLVLALSKQEAFQDELADELGLVQRLGLGKSLTPRTATRKAISRQLSVKEDSASNMLILTYTDTDKEFAAKAANAAVDILQKRFADVNLQLASDKLSAITDSIEAARKGLQDSQDKFTAFQVKYGFYDLESSTTTSLELISKAGQDLLALQDQYRSLSAYRKADDPQMIRLKQQIDQAKKRIQDLRSGSPELSGIALPADQLLAVASQYSVLKNDLAIQQGIYASLRQQLETTRVEEVSGSRIFTVIQRAQVPETKSGPSRGTLVIVITFAAFFLSILIAFIAEYVSRIKADPEEAEKLEALKSEFLPRKRGK